jgi:DNA-binding transcriptional ArsR family regulator
MRKGGRIRSTRKPTSRAVPKALAGRATLILETRQTGRRVRLRGAGTLPMKPANRKTMTKHLAGLAATLAALGSAERMEVLLALSAGRSTHAELALWTGLRPGPLYHHLNRLRLAGLLEISRRNVYELSRPGREALLAALAFADARKRR